jgi:hypothetical protein
MKGLFNVLHFTDTQAPTGSFTLFMLRTTYIYLKTVIILSIYFSYVTIPVKINWFCHLFIF